MKLSIATDFAGSTGDPRPRLREIAKAGFTHLHWCHQWCTDFLYTPPELQAIARTLEQTGLTLLDIHGSQGSEKCWNSPVEYQRRAGVLLVANRMWMLRQLGGIGTIMMHAPLIRYDTPKKDIAKIMLCYEALRKSIRELLPIARQYQAPIAVENMPDDTFGIINRILDEFPADLVGVCYDSGHGNINTCKGLDNLEKCKSRLMALHLHDNDRSGDQHRPPLYGNVDWKRLTRIIRDSGYPRPLSFEISLGVNTTPRQRRDFLADCFRRCAKVGRIYAGQK